MPTFNPMTGMMTPTFGEVGRGGGTAGLGALQGYTPAYAGPAGPLNNLGMMSQTPSNAPSQQMMNNIASQGLLGALGHGPALGFLLRGGSLGGLSAGNPYGSMGGSSLPYTTQQFGTPQAGGTNLLQPGKIQS